MRIRIGLLLIALVMAAGHKVRAQSPLTLAQVQELSEKNNPLLKVAKAHIARARAQKLQAWAGHLPTVRLSEGVMRSNDAVNAFGFRLKQERFSQADFAIDALNFPGSIVNFQTKIEVRQPLFNGGEAIYGRRQANVGVQLALGNFERTRSQINFEAARAYWGMVLAREALRAVQQGLATAQAHARIAEVRYEQETTDRVDLLAARVRVAELKGEEIEAQNQVASAVDGLALVMGIDIGTDVQAVDVLSRKPLPADLDILIGRAKKARPDLKVARLAVDAASSGVGKARSAFLPHLNAVAEWVLDSDDIYGRKGESWTAGAMMTWDVFSGGKTIGAMREARAVHEGAQRQVEYFEADVVREVRGAFRNVVAANARVDIAEDALIHAEERLRIAQLQYQEGLTTSTDLLTAESELRNARVWRLEALHSLNIGLWNLELSVGEGIR